MEERQQQVKSTDKGMKGKDPVTNTNDNRNLGCWVGANGPLNDYNYLEMCKEYDQMYGTNTAENKKLEEFYTGSRKYP